MLDHAVDPAFDTLILTVPETVDPFDGDVIETAPPELAVPLATVTVDAPDPSEFPLESNAVAVRLCVPFDTPLVFHEKLVGGVEAWYTPSRYQLLHDVPDPGLSVIVTVPETVDPFAGDENETPAHARLLADAKNKIPNTTIDMALLLKRHPNIRTLHERRPRAHETLLERPGRHPLID